MRTDLEPIVEKATPRASLGYSGIEKFSKLREQSLTRVASTTQIGLVLARNSFRIFDDIEVRKMGRKMIRSDARLRVAERRDRLSSFFDDRGFAVLAVVIVFAVISGFVAPTIAKLLLLVTSGWSANLPVLLAAFVGAATPIIIGLGALIGLYVWDFSVFGVRLRGLNWHRVPIADYLPPLISESQLARLETLNADLCRLGVRPGFFVRHGSASKMATLTETEKSLTAQGEQLKKWQQEAGFIELDLTFPDGEKTTLTIDRTNVLH